MNEILKEENMTQIDAASDKIDSAAPQNDAETLPIDDNNHVENAETSDADQKPEAAGHNDIQKAHVTLIERGERKWYVVGTAHVSDASRQEVENLIKTLHPDTVCVELCQERYDSFKDENRWAKLDIFQVIKNGKFLYLLGNLAVGAYQRRMGAKLGVKPGAELLGAIEVAEQNDVRFALIDRNINTTLKRVWANLGFKTKLILLSAIIESMLGGDDKEASKEDIENLKQDANLSSMMDEFAKEVPEVYTPLIDERDRYLAAKMRAAEGKTLIAVVGAGHVNGIKKYFDQEIDTDKIDVVPPPSTVWKILKWLIPAIILGGLIYGGVTKGQGQFLELLQAWIIPNSVFGLLGALLALAHPLTILASIFVSPLTSTTPVIGAGIVLGLLEAWLRKPTVSDCEDLVNVHTLKDFYKNPVTHILIVCFLTTLGSAIGAWGGIAWMIKILGWE